MKKWRRCSLAGKPLIQIRPWSPILERAASQKLSRSKSSTLLATSAQLNLRNRILWTQPRSLSRSGKPRRNRYQPRSQSQRQSRSPYRKVPLPSTSTVDKQTTRRVSLYRRLSDRTQRFHHISGARWLNGVTLEAQRSTTVGQQFNSRFRQGWAPSEPNTVVSWEASVVPWRS